MTEFILVYSPKYWPLKPQFNLDTCTEGMNVHSVWGHPDLLGQEDSGGLLPDISDITLVMVFVH